MFLKRFLQTPYLYILKLGNFKLDLIKSGKCGINYNVNGRILIQADNVFKTELKCSRISILCFCACTQAQHKIMIDLPLLCRGTQRQFSENICSEDDLRSRSFGTFVVKFLSCLSLLGFSNI